MKNDRPVGAASGYFTADSRGRMKFVEQDSDVEWDTDEEHQLGGS